MPDPSTAFADLLDRAETLIAALAPKLDPDKPFHVAAGDLDIADETPTDHRLFEIEDDPAPGLTESQFGTPYRRTTRSFTLSVRYDNHHDRRAFRRVVETDGNQLIGLLEAGTTRTSGVRIVQCTGGSVVDEGDFVTRLLVFSVVYDAPLS